MSKLQFRFLDQSETIIKWLILLSLILGLCLNLEFGLADNGDFGRIIRWFSSGPVGLSYWPEVGTDEYTQRFFDYWIPYWKLDFPENTSELISSSVLLLWLPGIIFNSILVSRSVLYLPFVSLLPRLLCFLFLWIILRWISKNETNLLKRLLLFISIGLLLTMMLITTGYQVYFNSFYQETASLIFMVATLISLTYLKREGTSIIRLLVVFFCIFLLVTAKPSNSYWAIIAIPFLIPWRSSWRKTFTHLLVSGFFAGLFFYISMQWGSAPYFRSINAYHSLFLGSLLFSSQPSERLSELGLDNAKICVGRSAFDQIGTQCHHRYSSQITQLTTIKVILREPLILPRMLKYAAEHMQRLNTGLGIRTIKQPIQEVPPTMQLWTTMKERLFPKGGWLLLGLSIFFGISSIGIFKAGLAKDLSIVGLLSSLGCLVDISVAVLMEGKADLVKHLFLANILFDIALISSISLVFILLLSNLEWRDLKI